MERSTNSLRFETDTQTLPETSEHGRCAVCGEEYETPLFAVVSSDYLVEEYYACPRCLSKVTLNVGRQKNVEVEKVEADEAEEENEAEEPEQMKVEQTEEQTGTCTHHLGYLKRRPKNTPIPEECLTCSKMIDCLSY
jgi:DNA-directed RNA polymerase subunit RPC12/RpoP